MEQFSGSLANYRVQLVVPALYDGEASSGVLRLARGSTEREFALERGFLVHERSSEPKEHLAQVLADLGVLNATRAAAAFEAASHSGMALGAFLVERGFAEPGRVQEALAHKAREAFFDCYAWEVGEIEFRPNAPLPDGGVRLKLPLGALHRDALARQKEWRVFNETFPAPDATFDVFREWAAVWGTEEEDALLSLAERGATLGELLASERGGPVLAARRVLQLYRRGVMSPRPSSGPRMGEQMDLTHLLDAAREFLARGEFEHAEAVTVQALDRAPVTEAQALFREAQSRLGLVIDDQVLALEGRIQFEALPESPPAALTADDLYVYSRLKGARSVRQTLREVAIGEVAAYRCVQRLMDAGLLRLGPAAPGAAARRHKTDPFGTPVPQA